MLPAVCRLYSSVFVVLAVWLTVLHSSRAAEPAGASSADTRLNTSVQRLEKMVYRQPRQGTAFDMWYRSYVQADRLPELIESARQRTLQQPGDPAAHLVWGMLCQRTGKDDDQAEAAYRTAADLAPKDYYARFLQGSLLIRKGRLREAADALSQSLELRPSPADYLSIAKQLGQLYLRLGQTAEATATWAAIAERFPRDVGVLVQLAKLQTQEKLYDAAIGNWQKVEQNSREDPTQRLEARVEIAQLNLEAGDFETALSQFDRALDQVRSDSWRASDLRKRIESAILGRNDDTRLVTFWQTRHKRRPDDLDSALQLGRAQAHAGHFAAAIKQYEQALKRAPGNRDLRQALIDALQQTGDHAATILQAETLAELFPKDPEAFFQLGTLYFRTSEPNDLGDSQRKAIAAWKRMAEIRPEDASLALRVAETCRNEIPTMGSAEDQPSTLRFALGSETSDDVQLLLDTAEQFYHEAMRRASDAPEYRERLGEFLLAAGRTQEASQAWADMATNDTAGQWHQLATVYARHGCYDEAIAAGAKSIERDADNLGYLDDQTGWLLKVQSYDAARDTVARLRELARDGGWQEKGIRRQVELAATAGRMEQEIRDIRRAISDGDETVANFWTLALLLARSENPVGASLYMDRALALDHDDVRLVRSMAELARAMGDWTNTLSQTRRLVDLDPANRVTYLKQIAELELRQNSPREAMAVADQLVELAPADAEGYRLRADVLFRLNEKTAAFGQLRRAIEIDPGNLDLRRQLARKLLEDGANDEAIEQYWQCFEQSEILTDRLSLVTAMSEVSKRSAGRERLLERLRSAHRQGVDPRSQSLCLAHALAEAGEVSESLRELATLHFGNPRDRDVLRQIVRTAEQGGDIAAAIDFQEKLATLEGTESSLRELARLYADAGDQEKAVTAWRRLLSTVRDPAAAMKIVDRQFLAGQLHSASILADAARDKFPGHWQFVYRSGVARIGLGEHEHAAALIEKVLAVSLAALDNQPDHRARSTDAFPASPESGPEELRELDESRHAYGRFRRLFELTTSAGSARQPPIVQVVLSDELSGAKRDCAMVMFLLRGQSERADTWLARLLTEPADDASQVRLAVLAALSALEYGDEVQLPRLLERLPSDEPLRHMVQLQVPAPVYSESPIPDQSALARWREPLHESYRWISQHRPDLRQHVRLPYGMNLALLHDQPGATRLLDQAIDESRELAELESLLPLIVQQASEASRRNLLLKVAEALRQVTDETLREDQLRQFLAFALRHAAEDFADDAVVQSVLVILDRYLARSQVGVTTTGETPSYWQSAADFFLTVLMQQVRSAQQRLIQRDDLSPQERSRMHNQIQTELTRVRQMRQAASSTLSRNAAWNDPLDFPSPDVHVDANRFQVLQVLHGILRRFGKDSVLTGQLDQRLVAKGHPDRVGFALAKSYALWWSGDHEDSLVVLEQVCHERPDDNLLRFALARAYFHAGRLRDSLKHVDQLLVKWPFGVGRGGVIDLRSRIVRQWSTVAKVFDLEGHTGVVHSLAFSPRGEILASASVDKTVRLWDIATGQLKSIRSGHTDMVLCVAFSSNGQSFASGGYDRTVRVWDLDREEVSITLEGHTDVVRAVAFSPDGKTIASTGDDRVLRLWDAKLGRLIHALGGHTERVLALAFAPDGLTLATGSGDGSIRLWDVADGKLRETLRGHSRPVTSISFVTGKPMLASAGEDGRVVLWSQSNKVLDSIDTSSPVRSMALSRDGRTIATGCHDCSVKLWDVATRSVRFDLRDQTRTEQPVVAFSPDGRLLASAGYDGAIRLWRADDEALRSPPAL